ncbi:hypothetical protein SAMN04489806_1399 [Paramicrobacterium humi]|uniref:OsmC-like protein n=1 Tax=Paramicrobacterium humi TaxID=640635 RepID=A0A1H4L437_9MICO|nr:hypothetical protein [Microbacterium humi]SEB64942.1 hypothetical protein SAMN04489806_1399 [Microbacterium humi]
MSPHFHDYELTLRVLATAPREALDDLARESEKRCPAINLVRDAGVPLVIHWQFGNVSDDVA